MGTTRVVSALSRRLDLACGLSGRGRTSRRTNSRAMEPLEDRTLFAAPVVVYNFDEGGGTTVADSSPAGGANNGTLTGEIPPEFLSDGTSPAGGSHLRFNGDGWPGSFGGRVETDEGLDLVLGGSSTMAYWVRTFQSGNFTTDPVAITGVEQRGTANDVIWGMIDDNSRIGVRAGDGAAAVSSSPISDFQWHHVTHTRNAASGRLRTYVDGRLVGDVVGEAGPKTSDFRAIGATTILDFFSTQIAGYVHFNGELDQVEIYDAVLSPQEVAAEYGPAAGQPPAAPTELTTSPTIVRGLKLTFTDSPGALGYIIRRANSAAGPFTEVATISGDPFTTTESYYDTGLTAGATYHYQVTAFNAAGESAPATAFGVPQATGSGHTAHYFDSAFWGRGTRPANWSDPNRVVGVPQQTVLVGDSIDYIWSGAPTPPFAPSGLRTDGYSTAFSGKVKTNEEGLYGFVSHTDDDGILYVNGQRVSDDPGPHPARDAWNVEYIHLEGNTWYEFLLLQADVINSAAAGMKWVTPTGFQTELIPVENLDPISDAPAAPSGFSASAQPDGTVWIQGFDNAVNEWRFALERRAAGASAFERVRTSPLSVNFDGQPSFVGFSDFPLAGGDYEYRVVAENAAGSTPSETFTVTAAGANIVQQPGAQGFYYNSEFWGTGTPPRMYEPIAEANLDYTETVPWVNFDYGGGSPAGPIMSDGFSTAFTGTIRTVEAGTYTFAAISDDDSYLYVNGVLVSAAPGPHGMFNPRFTTGNGSRVVPITLEADTEYNFVALQSEGAGAAGIILEWVRPGHAGEVIPPENYASNIPSGPGGTATGAPVAPSGLGVAGGDLGASFVVLTWDDDATNEMRYVLERSTNSGFTDAVPFSIPINATRYIDDTVEPSTEYHYRLRAVNFYGASGGATAAVTTLAADPRPAAPQDLIAVARATGVRLSFTDASTAEQEFIVRRAPAGSGDFEDVGTVPGSAIGETGARLAFVDESAVAGQAYDYLVVATNTGGDSDPSNTATVTAGSPGGTGVRAEYYNEQFFQGESVVLEHPVDADEFFGFFPGTPDPRIDGDTFSGVFHGELLAEFSETYTFYTASDDGLDMVLIDPDTGEVILRGGAPQGIETARPMPPVSGFQDIVGTVQLEAGRRYLIQWRMNEAFGEAGYRLGWSSDSIPQEVLPTELLFPVDPATTPLFPVSDLRGTALGGEQISLLWSEFNFGESGFEIQRRLIGEPDSAFATLGTAPANATSFTDTQGIEDGQAYVYRVRAVRGDEAGPFRSVAVSTVTVAGNTYNGTAVALGGPDGDVTTGEDNVLRLTDNENFVAGSVFTNGAYAVDGNFAVRFDFSIPEPMFAQKADGFTFVIQRQGPTALGDSGSGLGYLGINNSIAVKFDTYPFGSSTLVYANGHMDDNGIFMPFDIGDGRTYRVDLVYNADFDMLEQTVVPLDEFGQPIPWEAFQWTHFEAWDTFFSTVPLDVASIIGGANAHVGFTAATGGLNAEHLVSNFFFNGEQIQFLPTEAAAPAASLAVGSASATLGGTTTLTATLLDSDGDPLAGRTVTFRLNGALVGTGVTDANGVATLSGVSVAGIQPGSYPGAITVGFVGDESNGPAEGAGTLTVSYAVRLGFNNTRPVQRGSVVPVRLTLTDAAGTNVSSASTPVTATRLVSSSGQTTTPRGPGGSHAGGLFNYDPVTNSYQFNLSTTRLAAGTYTLYFTAGNDPIQHGVQLTLV